MKSDKFLKIYAAAASAMIVALSVQAQTTPVYENTLNDQNSNITNSPAVAQIGEEILMDPTQLAANPYLWSFSYEYYSPDATFNGSVSGRVQFFYNSGTLIDGYHSPSTAFYDTGWFSLLTPQQQLGPGNTVATLPFVWQDLYAAENGALLNMDTQMQLPSDFTVVFSFQDLGVGNTVGLANFNAPTVGNNHDDYWMNTNTIASPMWSLVNLANTGVGMQLDAGPTPAPEPSVIALGTLGGLLMTQLIRRRKV